MSISTSQIVINFGNYHHMIYKVTYFITFGTPESVKKTKLSYIFWCQKHQHQRHVCNEPAIQPHLSQKVLKSTKLIWAKKGCGVHTAPEHRLHFWAFCSPFRDCLFLLFKQKQLLPKEGERGNSQDIFTSPVPTSVQQQPSTSTVISLVLWQLFYKFNLKHCLFLCQFLLLQLSLEHLTLQFINIFLCSPLALIHLTFIISTKLVGFLANNENYFS
jgi:hypothetical protein